MPSQAPSPFSFRDLIHSRLLSEGVLTGHTTLPPNKDSDDVSESDSDTFSDVSNDDHEPTPEEISEVIKGFDIFRQELLECSEEAVPDSLLPIYHQLKATERGKIPDNTDRPSTSFSSSALKAVGNVVVGAHGCDMTRVKGEFENTVSF